MSALYLIGAGFVASSHLIPLAFDVGLWGITKMAKGVYWMAFGGSETESEEMRLRRIIREEIAQSASEAPEDVVDDCDGKDG